MSKTSKGTLRSQLKEAVSKSAEETETEINASSVSVNDRDSDFFVSEQEQETKQQPWVIDEVTANIFLLPF